jgi:hypothetical protein
VFVSYSYLVYQGGVRDGVYDGYEVICGEDNIVLSTNIYTREEEVRCRIDSDFIDYRTIENNKNFEEGLN